MKYIYALFLLVVFSQIATSQELVTPKPGQISTENDGFKITFPSTPVRNVRPADPANGKQEIIQYITGGERNTYIAIFSDFPTVLDKASVNARFELAKLSMLTPPGSTLVRETPVTSGDYYWKDIITEEEDDSTHFTRIIIARQRLFQIFYIAHERLSKATEQAREYHEKEAEKFFNSFSIIKLPEPKFAVEFPSDFKVRIEKGVFYSDYLGFSIHMPVNWKKLTKEQMRLAYNTGLQSKGLKSTEAKLNRLNIAILLSLVKEDRIQANVMALTMSVEKTEYPDVKPDAAIKGFIKHVLADDEKALKMLSASKIGGKDFAWTETQGGKGNPRQRIYMGNVKGMIFTIAFTYQNPNSLKHLLSLLNTAKFTE